ncbi:hypothetical protein AWW66_15335 [Micromonospora rosaria]|uniref:Uncharacterized protein n=1 Tax=Micromonospora rosaria TaxID=47874 RepID=A0A136PRN9_9ACTN|nr:hypothetical protein [Micromonospora rosaria]KXK61078.1 hypothetical protein AWW66_15335 [Micromonospora rosaria]
MEVWLTGTTPELAAAIDALTAAAYVVFRGDPHPLAGVDAGRHRVYLRLALTATARPARPVDRGGQGAALIDLDTARATRRAPAWKETPGA